MRFLTAAVSEPGDAGGVDGGESAGVWPERGPGRRREKLRNQKRPF